MQPGYFFGFCEIWIFAVPYDIASTFLKRISGSKPINLNTLAPIILFVYNRPDHARQCLDALARNVLAAESQLIVFSDGAKAAATADEKQKIQEVRALFREEHRFRSVELHASDTNKGLSASIIQGVTAVVEQHGKAIILEDDLITDEYFLTFMNDALRTYEADSRVACISGYIYPVEETLPALFFLKGADCWGWATWKRSWQLFEQDGQALLQQLRQNDLAHDFNFYDSYPYVEMLEDQIRGKNNSWAIRWYAAAYLQNKLTLYPGQSLVQNIGFDGTGTHSGRKSIRQTRLLHQERRLQPVPVAENGEAKQVIARYFRKRQAGTIFTRVKTIIRSFFK